MESKVGPYQLGESLGALPFGELVAATHTSRSESLAVLLLDERLTKEPRFRGLLRLEVARAGGLRHPAVARPIEVIEHARSLYVVIERPDGATLLASTKAAAPTPERVVALIQALAAALDAAHDRRLVHGILGPSSILVRPDGSPALVGLGLLGAVEEASLGAVIADAVAAAVTAPEQRTGPRLVASADGFALASLAASLLSTTSDDARAVLDRQLAESPTNRFPTCTAFAAALADALTSSAPAPADVADLHAPLTPAPAAMPPATPTPPLPTPSPTTPTLVAPEPRPAPARVAAPETPPPLPSARTASPEAAAPDPAPTSPLPWEAAAHVQLAADSEDVASEPLPWSPDAHPSAPSIAVVEPAAATVSDEPASPALLWTGPPPVAPESSVVVRPASSAVLVCLSRLESRDPLGDGVHWVADRVPAIARLLDRICIDGKVGPVPLGIAMAGLLALLLLVTEQIVPAMAVVGLVVVLYGFPTAIKKLTGEADTRYEVTQVTGAARLSGRTDGMLGGQPHLGLSNHMLLSLTPRAFDSLARYAVPVQVDRPIPGTIGVRPVIIAYDLPAVTVSYVSSNRLLLDVRAPTGVILYRYPAYDGEPDDGPLAPDDGTTPPPAITGPHANHGSTQSATYQAAADHPVIASSPDSRSKRHPMSPELKNILQRSSTAAFQRAGLIMAGPIAIALVVLFAGYGFFSFMALFAGFFMSAASFSRGFTLRNLRDIDFIVQAIGPISVSSRKSGRSRRYHVHVLDGTEIEIDQSLFSRLSREGQPPASTAKDSPLEDFFRAISSPDRYDLPSVTTTYVGGGLLLLEVVNPFGTVLYRDQAITPADLPRRPRTI